MVIKSLKNLGHSCFLNSVLQAILGISSVSKTLDAIEGDFVLMNELRKLHARRRSECLSRLETVLQSAMDKGRRGTARSTSSKLSRLLELLPQIASGISPPTTPGRSMNEVVTALNLSFTEQLVRMHALLKEVSSQKESVNPMSLYLSFLSHSTLFPEAFEQNDVSEFLFFLLDTVHTELVAARHTEIPCSLISFDDQFSSEFCDLFRGQHVGGMPFLEIQLQIPMLQLLVSHFSPPHGWQLAPLSVAHCVRGTHVARAPPVLVLNFNRAQFAGGKASKNTVHVAIDFEIQIDTHHYELAALVVHQGEGSHGGHYSTFAKRERDWHYFNDSQVKLAGPFEAVLNELAKNAKHYQPCLLFYEKSVETTDKSTSFSTLPRGAIETL